MEVADFAAESVIVYDLDGSVMYCNPASERLFGWSRMAMVGQHVSNVAARSHISPAVWEQLIREGAWEGLIDRTSLTGSSVSAEARLAIRRSDLGEPIDIVEYSSPALSVLLPPTTPSKGLGRAACWQFNLSEMIETLAADQPVYGESDEARPRAGQSRGDALLASLGVMSVNDEASQLFRLEPDLSVLRSRPVTSLWPEELHPLLLDLLTTIAQKQNSDPEMVECQSAGRLNEVTLTGWKSADPKCPHIVFVYVSADEYSPAAVQELEASQERYRNIFSSLPIPVWHVDIRAMSRVLEQLKADGVTDMEAYSQEHPEVVELACELVVVSDLNKEAVALFGGTDKSEFIGPVDYFFAEAPDAALRVMLAHAAGLRNYVDEFKVRTRDGRLIDIMLLCTFPVSGERLDTSIIMAIDITSRLQSEARLRQVESDFTHASRLSTLGELTASIAHEIKQPLSAILTNAQTNLRYLSHAEPNVEKLKLLTGRIVESSERANEIIGRIREMAGKRLPTRDILDLNDVVRECLVFLRHETDHSLVAMDVSLDANLPNIMGDKVQMQQIVVNLIVNSLQAMQEEPRHIRLTTRVDEVHGVVLTISDSGPGIPEAHMGQIFDGFFTTKHDGLGIGLAICQSIVRAHGGVITASNAPAGGAVFRFSVPLADDADISSKAIGTGEQQQGA
jgi:two-component system sensor kinase FixL